MSRQDRSQRKARAARGPMTPNQRVVTDTARPVGAWRGQLVLGVFAAGLLVLLGRAYELQVRDRAFLEAEGAKRFERTLTVPAGRAAIRDRRGEPLALSAPVESVWAVPADLLADHESLPLIAELTGRSEAELTTFLTARRERRFVYLERQMSPTDARRVQAVGAAGVFLQREYRRFYPAGEIAAQLVGVTDIDNRGQEGMELAFNDMLQGVPGTRRVIRDRTGRVVEDLAEFTPPDAGQDLHLSIDLRLQYVAYRELKNAVASHGARGGAVVMLDPRTGEVLAMASQPGFNPNNRSDLGSAGMRNRVVTDVFEPGSTVKPLLIAHAMDVGVVDWRTRVQTGAGFWQVGRLTVRDFRGYGELGLAGVLRKSSNIGAAKIGLELGAEGVWAAYQRFGLAEPVGTAFPGEATGVLRHFSEWGDVATATSAYGYGLAVSALQLGRAYAALADDGRLRPLTLLRRDTPETHFRQVIAPEHARRVRHWLEGVVAPDGTASRAAVAGYRVAGKTGTVRKVTADGYTEDAHLALFAGMMPADNPRVVALVVIDEPTAGEYYGGAVAAPVFAEVMRSAARLLQLPPADFLHDASPEGGSGLTASVDGSHHS